MRAGDTGRESGGFPKDGGHHSAGSPSLGKEKENKRVGKSPDTKTRRTLGTRPKLRARLRELDGNLMAKRGQDEGGGEKSDKILAKGYHQRGTRHPKHYGSEKKSRREQEGTQNKGGESYLSGNTGIREWITVGKASGRRGG